MLQDATVLRNRVNVEAIQAYQRSQRLIWVLCMLQLANIERRLAKRKLQGKYARARVFYRAATEELQECQLDFQGSERPAAQSPKPDAESADSQPSSGMSGCSPQKDLVLGLQSWARMEGFLG